MSTKIRQEQVLEALKTYTELTNDVATLTWEDAGTVRFYRMTGRLSFAVIGAAAAHLAIVSYIKGWVDALEPERITTLSGGDRPVF